MKGLWWRCKEVWKLGLGLIEMGEEKIMREDERN